MSDTDGGDLSELDIDRLGQQMLAKLDALGGESNSKELRGELDDVGHTPFNYRLTTYLEPLGLVETHQPDASPGNIPPKEITLTDAGKEFVESMSMRAGDDVGSRLEQLEDRVETLQQENQELRETNRELKAAIDRQGMGELAGEVDSLRTEFSQLQNQLQAVKTDVNAVLNNPVIANDIAPTIINASFVLANTSKVLLQNQFDEEHIEEKRSEVKSQLQDKEELI